MVRREEMVEGRKGREKEDGSKEVRDERTKEGRQKRRKTWMGGWDKGRKGGRVEVRRSKERRGRGEGRKGGTNTVANAKPISLAYMLSSNFILAYNLIFR